ncbi:hypothetical protein AB0G04_10630 [Actinoplanes sp. NPDC023801]|uniref:hypothetical protein n=1 Tax=Actinoplanes sp. NPDC023801 TaxID=3154595 RepID=UPI0034071EB7
MQSIEVTAAGITITSVTEPFVSVFGKVMSPHSTHVDEIPWDEIYQVHIEVLDLPDGERWVTLVVDLTWGEFVEVRGDADGVTAAIRELCRLSGVPVPAEYTEAVIWPTA